MRLTVYYLNSGGQLQTNGTVSVSDFRRQRKGAVKHRQEVDFQGPSLGSISLLGITDRLVSWGLTGRPKNLKISNEDLRT